MEGWEYDEHPNRDSVTQKCFELQGKLASCSHSREAAIQNTRPFHLEIFSEVTPDGKEHFAGSYRGTNHPYLAAYNVSIASYSGAPAPIVDSEMHAFHQQLLSDLQQMQSLKQKQQVPETYKIMVLAHIISRYTVTFLAIHPYANGNGHISRLIAWVIFCIHGFHIKGWNLDQRPSQPFDHFIGLYRQGQKDAMASYFLEMLQSQEIPNYNLH